DAAVGAAEEDEVVGGGAVADGADDDLGAVAARRPAARRQVVAPYLTVQADAEDLVVGGDDVGEVAARVLPRRLGPGPDAVVGRPEDDDVVAGVGVAGVDDDDLDAVAARVQPGIVAAAVAPDLSLGIQTEGLTVAADDGLQRRERVDGL